MSNDKGKLKPTPGENVYVGWDNEFECFGVFGTDSGFCYGEHEEEDAAERDAADRNERSAAR